MQTSVWKYFVDSEKEEAWINEMADKGWLLIRCRGLHTFDFEQGLPGEYTYRLILMEKGIKHPESISYIQFLEESGITYTTTRAEGGNSIGILVAATRGAWVYLRKRTADGPFELYSDNASLMKHYRTLATQWLWLLAIVSGICAANVFIGSFVFISGLWVHTINLVGAVALTPLIWHMYKQWRRDAGRAARLKAEQDLYE